MFIVNHPNGNTNFIQTIDIVQCVRANRECGDGAITGARTECHQEYLVQKLVGMTPDGREMKLDPYRFPSCCTCRIIKD